MTIHARALSGTVGLRAHDEAAHFDGTLRSLRVLFYPRLEIIVRDKTSGNDTVAICRTHAAEDALILLVESKIHDAGVKFRRASYKAPEQRLGLVAAGAGQPVPDGKWDLLIAKRRPDVYCAGLGECRPPHRQIARGKETLFESVSVDPSDREFAPRIPGVVVVKERTEQGVAVEARMRELGIEARR